jgi:hypothetical protein
MRQLTCHLSLLLTPLTLISTAGESYAVIYSKMASNNLLRCSISRNMRNSSDKNRNCWLWKYADRICWQNVNLLTRKICWQNLLTKNKSADKRNLLTESADKNWICWQPKNRAGSTHQNLILKLRITPARPWLARTFLQSNLKPVYMLGPDLPGTPSTVALLSRILLVYK